MITKSEYFAITKEEHSNHPDFINLTKKNFSFAI